MPYSIKKKGSKYELIKTTTGQVLGTSPYKSHMVKMISAIEINKKKKKK